MADGTHIEWTDASWNAIRAQRRDGQPNKGPGGWTCVRVSDGCKDCYAATINKRLGTGLDYTVTGEAASVSYIDEAALTLPLRWKKPRKVFVGSMTDIFGAWVTDDMLDRIFAVMALTPHHTYQVLTKRPERMREYLQKGRWRRVGLAMRSMSPRRHTPEGIAEYAAVGDGRNWPLPNVWLGVSVENQEAADKRIPVLLETPAAVRFLSCEPLLGAVDLEREHMWIPLPCPEGCGCKYPLDADVADCACDGPCCYDLDVFNGREPDLDWIIVGGESGAGSRPMDIEWARSLVHQCKAAGVAVFVKQLGAKPIEFDEPEGTPGGRKFHYLKLKNRKGGDPEEWPEDLRVREFPRGVA